jgi:hypothetical protein
MRFGPKRLLSRFSPECSSRRVSPANRPTTRSPGDRQDGAWAITLFDRKAQVPKMPIAAIVVQTIRRPMEWHRGERWTKARCDPGVKGAERQSPAPRSGPIGQETSNAHTRDYSKRQNAFRISRRGVGRCAPTTPAQSRGRHRMFPIASENQQPDHWRYTVDRETAQKPTVPAILRGCACSSRGNSASTLLAVRSTQMGAAKAMDQAPR